MCQRITFWVDLCNGTIDHIDTSNCILELEVWRTQNRKCQYGLADMLESKFKRLNNIEHWGGGGGGGKGSPIPQKPTSTPVNDKVNRKRRIQNGECQKLKYFGYLSFKTWQKESFPGCVFRRTTLCVSRYWDRLRQCSLIRHEISSSNISKTVWPRITKFLQAMHTDIVYSHPGYYVII